MNKKSMFDVVKSDLMLLETELLSVIHSPEKLITDISKHLVEAGGKRLRPALYFMCTKGRVTDMEKIMPMAVAIELIHMATLVHDDVIDNAATRRGKATANSCWGNHSSVLIGDYLFAKAFSLVANKVSNEMLKVLTDVICSMCEGEINQNRSTFHADQKESDYLGRIEQKTANFIAASCELGGLAVGLPIEETKALREYGYSLGMAFQITDDILDVTASSEQIGKPVGNDLRQGIVTLPIIYALEHSLHKDELHEIVQTKNMSEEKIKRGLTILHETDAIEYSYSRVADYLKYAREVIPANIVGDHREAFIAVADFVGLRNY
ncbi:heptaprenyl diphosphate synthase [Pelosinus propionicus DSM 13327]|uniref:Heptaprenyl diphosphate synthase n=2 Tax=Pelosinus TaxID=365348 RepID=A0A1I4JJN1_9FIRM|nr:heptaprenyl diphosphate synthase [Pelosinus propionicus DSM 13327]